MCKTAVELNLSVPVVERKYNLILFKAEKEFSVERLVAKVYKKICKAIVTFVYLFIKLFLYNISHIFFLSLDLVKMIMKMKTFVGKLFFDVIKIVFY